MSRNLWMEKTIVNLPERVSHVEGFHHFGPNHSLPEQKVKWTGLSLLGVSKQTLESGFFWVHTGGNKSFFLLCVRGETAGRHTINGSHLCSDTMTSECLSQFTSFPSKGSNLINHPAKTMTILLEHVCLSPKNNSFSGLMITIYFASYRTRSF